MVIGLQSTGEANTNQTREEEGDVLDDFVSAPKRILSLFLSRHFPTDSCDMESHELDLLQHQVTLPTTKPVPGVCFTTAGVCLLQLPVYARPSVATVE